MVDAEADREKWKKLPSRSSDMFLESPNAKRTLDSVANAAWDTTGWGEATFVAKGHKRTNAGRRDNEAPTGRRTLADTSASLFRYELFGADRGEGHEAKAVTPSMTVLTLQPLLPLFCCSSTTPATATATLQLRLPPPPLPLPWQERTFSSKGYSALRRNASPQS